MDNGDNLVRLAGIVATRTSEALRENSPGAGPDTRLSALLDALELFVPQVLRTDFPEWEAESLDGFLVAEAKKTGERLLSVAGLAILISDQTVTPFQVVLHSALDGSLARAECLVGERGGGVLGISGSVCTAPSVPRQLERLVQRLSTMDWVYRATYSKPDTRAEIR